jgi:hypothetical protein
MRLVEGLFVSQTHPLPDPWKGCMARCAMSRLSLLSSSSGRLVSATARKLVGSQKRRELDSSLQHDETLAAFRISDDESSRPRRMWHRQSNVFLMALTPCEEAREKRGYLGNASSCDRVKRGEQESCS